MESFEVATLHAKAGDHGFSAEATVLLDGSPRVIQIDGIAREAHLDETLLFMRNEDRPGVIGHIGSTLGKHAVNIATFALGRRGNTPGAGAGSAETSGHYRGPVNAFGEVLTGHLSLKPINDDKFG